MPKNSQKCKGFEVFQRLNYLFQIRDAIAEKPMLSTYYGNLIINIAKKAVLRIDPSLKRSICKRCRGPLLPGKSVKVNVKKKDKTPMVLWKCSQCHFIKRYPITQKQLWTEKPESIVEKLDYSIPKPTLSKISASDNIAELPDPTQVTNK